MELYLIKSTVCLALIFAFYKFFLEKESMHRLKRFYLLGGIATSFLAPALTFTQYIEVTPAPAPVLNHASISLHTTEIPSGPDYLTIFLWVVYLLGVVFFTFKFGKNLYIITQKITKNQRIRSRNLFHVLLKIPTTPHTFFNYIFLHKQSFEANEIPKEVLLHEQVHAEQKHSFDTVFMEVVQIIFWFNPLVYWVKQAIKLNHEFLADQGVLQQGTDKLLYQHILLAFSSGAATPSMANSINYSSLKKRFTVMKANTSTRAKWIKGLLVIPLLSLLIYGFSNRKLAVEPNESTSEVITSQQNNPSPKEIGEYNQLAKKYNAQPKNSRVVPLSDLKRMEEIYRKMTVSQKEESQPFPECPPPPPPAPPAPPTPPVASLDPVDHLIRMAKENAVFFYEDLPVSSEEAMKLLKKNSNLNIETVRFKNSNPIVKITPGPITPSAPKALPAPDPAANLVEIAKRGGQFYLNGKEVSAEKAIKALRENEGSKIDIDETNPDHPVVWISGC